MSTKKETLNLTTNKNKSIAANRNRIKLSKSGCYAMPPASVLKRKKDTAPNDASYVVLNGYTGTRIIIKMENEEPIFAAERWTSDVFSK